MTEITLRAAEGVRPLADARVRATVISAAEALGERTGVGCRVRRVDDASITIEVDGPGIAALGFAAELRRTTNEWAVRRGHCVLWPDEPAGTDETDGPWIAPDDADDDADGEGDAPGGPR